MLAQIDTDLPNALNDCRRAMQAGSPSMWPYYFLAWDALRQRNYTDTWQLCLRAALSGPLTPTKWPLSYMSGWG